MTASLVDDASIGGVSMMEALSALLDVPVTEPAPTGPSPAEISKVVGSFSSLSPHGDWLVKYFYAHLFTNHPEVRPLFPENMSGQRDRFLFALVRLVGDMAEGKIDTVYLERLGKSHAKHLGVAAAHYPAAGDSLIATLRKFHGQHWTPALEASWIAAYQSISDAMLAGVAES